MPIPSQHARRFVYHTTHILNLEGILGNGILSYNEQRARGIEHYSIAADTIQMRRARMTATAGPGGVVHDYTPLYFTKLSPMLLQVVNAKNVDQKGLLHFAFPISIIDRDNVIFTDMAANSASPPNFFHLPEDLVKLNWGAIDLATWGSKIDGVDVKQARMAEVLVHRRLDASEAAFVVVWNEYFKEKCLECYQSLGLAAPRFVFDSQGERHTFVEFRKNWPKDMLGRSIAAGPMETQQRFQKVVTELTTAADAPGKPRFSSVVELLEAFRAHGLGIIPETAELIDLASANPAHADDVGTHTLKVVQQLHQSGTFVMMISRDDEEIVELAAYLHDIGKGPKSRWSGCKGIQQPDRDHPIRSAEMLPRILTEEVRVAPEVMETLCKLVCYHDLVGDIIERGRHREELADVANTVRDLELLILIAEADINSRDPEWSQRRSREISDLSSWAEKELVRRRSE